MTRIRRIKRRKAGRAVERVDAEMNAILPSRFRAMQKAGSVPRVAIVGSRIFNLKLAKALAAETSIEIVATTDSPRDALAVSALHGAEVALVEVEMDGAAGGILLARSIIDRSPECGIMLVCRSLPPSTARYLWVYGTESWSVLTSATSQNPAQVAEAINSTARGMTWVEPGIARALAEFGLRPKSVEERRLRILDDLASAA